MCKLARDSGDILKFYEAKKKINILEFSIFDKYIPNLSF